MKVLRIKWMLCALMCLISGHIYAQRTITASGTYEFQVPGNMSLDEAKNKAVEYARVQLIADNFGTIVDMNSLTEVSNKNGQSSVEMLTISYSDVKGEWIEDLQKPEFDMDVDKDGKLLINVTVKGRIREIVSADIDLKIKVLRNGVEDRFEADYFKNNDDLYMSFLSPVDGYLAVYLYDGTNVFRLLPYKEQQEGYFKAERNKRYVLFSQEHITYDIPSYQVPELIMATSQTREINRLFVIFSPNKFVQATDSVESDIPYLDYKSFQRWLTRCRNRDNEMMVQEKIITITND